MKISVVHKILCINYSVNFSRRGQLGIGELTTSNSPVFLEAFGGIKMVDIAAKGWHSGAVSAFGDLYMWGWDTSGQLGIKSNSEDGGHSPSVHALPQLIDFEDESINISKVFCGSRHTIVKTERDEYFGSGWNRYGQLGYKVDAIEKESDIKSCGSTYFRKLNLPLEDVHWDIVCGNWSTILRIK